MSDASINKNETEVQATEVGTVGYDPAKLLLVEKEIGVLEAIRLYPWKCSGVQCSVLVSSWRVTMGKSSLLSMRYRPSRKIWQPAERWHVPDCSFVADSPWYGLSYWPGHWYIMRGLAS